MTYRGGGSEELLPPAPIFDDTKWNCDQWSASSAIRFTLGGNSHLSIGDYLGGPQSRSGRCVEVRHFCPFLEANTDCPTFWLYYSHCIGWAISVPLYRCVHSLISELTASLVTTANLSSPADQIFFYWDADGCLASQEKLFAFFTSHKWPVFWSCSIQRTVFVP
jgi:hypothetical protein